MESSDEDRIKATILYHLRRKRVIGNVHTHFDTLKKGFPSHLGKDIKKIARQLIKQALIVTKPAPYGLQVSLNKNKLKEIDEFIHRVLGFRF
ncbi:MAG TPA: hypothetical protein VMX17_14660 [Candidatus Glassbacteria bacterium]|nr:hypothetical protein [Candidatus Glassbacteria bacterium]